MHLFKILIVLAISLSSWASDDFDLIFGENKKIENQKDQVHKQESDDIMDELLGAEKFNKQKIEFEAILKDAKKQAYDYKNYSKAYRLLNDAYAMKFDNKKVTSVKNGIKSAERKHLEKKRLEYERKAKQREERIAREKREAYQKQMAMKALNDSLIKQQQETNRILAQTNQIIQNSYKNNYTNNSYKNYNNSSNTYSSNSYKAPKNSYSSKTTNSYTNKSYTTPKNNTYSSNSSNSYEKKLAEQKRLQEQKQREQKRKELEIKKQKEIAEAKRLREEKKRELELKKQREKELREKEERDYLAKLKNGIRLKAKNCFGEHHVGGLVPKIKPRPFSCIDVSFVAYCSSSPISKSYGIMKNMISNAGGCYGDTKEVKPKLACKAEDYIVKVTNVSRCK